MKNIFIINPVAGKQNYLSIIKNIEKYFSKNKDEYRIHITTKPKEATEFAKLYKKETNIIYSVGGDGTLHEVVAGIVGTKNKLGIIPNGSGNDFYRTISALKMKEIKSDVGMINGEYFINTVSFGLDAEIGATALKMKGKVPPSQIYNAAILFTVFGFKTKKVEFNLNKTRMVGNYTIVTICIGKYYGGGFYIAPEAEVDDNLFDIYFVDKISKLQLPKLILKLKEGTHGDSPLVHKRKADSIKVKSDVDIIGGADGEILIGKNFDIKLLKNAITIYNDNKMVESIIGK